MEFIAISNRNSNTCNSFVKAFEIIFREIVEKNPGSRRVTPIQLAAIQGHLKTSEMILDKVVDKTPNISTKKYNEELLDALELF